MSVVERERKGITNGDKVGVFWFFPVPIHAGTVELSRYVSENDKFVASYKYIIAFVRILS